MGINRDEDFINKEVSDISKRCNISCACVTFPKRTINWERALDYVVNFAYKRSGERSLRTLRGFDYSLLVTKWVGAAEISEPGGAS